MAENEEKLKSTLMRVKEKWEKAGLKVNIKKKETQLMASGSITSWQIEGGKEEIMMDFLYFGSKITEDGDCSHEIRRCLLLGRKAVTNIDSVLKSRDIALPTKVHIVKAMVILVVTKVCESWTECQKAECRRTDALNCVAREDS